MIFWVIRVPDEAIWGAFGEYFGHVFCKIEGLFLGFGAC